MAKQRLMIPMIVVLCGVMLFPAVKRDNKVFPVNADGSMVLKNVNGSIALSTHDRAEIRVEMEKIAKTAAELDEVKVRVNLEGNRLEVDVKRMRRNTRTRVNFKVVVPKGLAEVELKSVNGSVKSRGDLGSLTLESVNGSVSQRGLITDGNFRTVNGGIELVHAGALSGDLAARSVNGAIQLEIDRASEFSADGSTLNGSVKTDFDLDVEKHLVGRSLSGRVGSAKYSLRVKTVNGGIKILAI